MQKPMDEFKNRFNKAISIRNIKPIELAQKTGLSKSTISHYMSGYTKPKSDKLFILAQALNIDETWLMGYDVPMERKTDAEKFGEYADQFNKSHTEYMLSDEEMEVIEIMRSSSKLKQRLTAYNNSFEKVLIDKINCNLIQFNTSGLNQVNSYTNDLLKITDYCKEHLNEAEIISFKNSMSIGEANKIKMHLYTFMQKIACAGGGFIFDDIPTDVIEAPYMEGADFIIGVNGDSMEPTFFDGDKVYVEKMQMVEIGDIGIFMINNECFIKEAGEDGLISHNSKYDMIPGTENVQCIGKVLGKVIEEPLVNDSSDSTVLSIEDLEALRIGRELIEKKSSIKKNSV